MKNGGRPGIYLLKVQIEDDEKYKLNGIDLYTNLYLTPWGGSIRYKGNIKLY